MIKHIVWWTLKPEADGRSAMENARLIKEQGEALMGHIPGLRSIEISTTILPSSTVAVHLVLQSTHDTAADLQAYAVHPLHQEVGKRIGMCAENRQCLDYEI